MTTLLFIAPASNLSGNAEFMRIASGNTVEVVDGLLDRAGLERALRTPYDAVHFCGHAGKSVLELSDGVLDAADFVSMLDRQRQALFFFVNGCESLAVGVAIHNALHMPVVAHDAEIDDKAAVRFAESYYRNYRTTRSARAAFATARETLLRLYPTQAQIPCLVNGDMARSGELVELREQLRVAVEHLDGRMDGLETMFTQGRSRYQAAQLVLLALLLLAQLAASWLPR